MTPRERAYQLRDALRARGIALDVTAVDAVEAAILADRAERDAVRESACAAYERALAEQAAGEAERTAQAVARAYEDAAGLVFHHDTPARSRGRIRARATSPAPEPVAAERATLFALVERAAKLGRLAFSHHADCPHYECDNCEAESEDDCMAAVGAGCECSVWEITRLAADARDALAAARKGGAE